MMGRSTCECTRCGRGLESIRAEEVRLERGHLWHLPCAITTENGQVDPPSPGKLMPCTIVDDVGVPAMSGAPPSTNRTE